MSSSTANRFVAVSMSRTPALLKVKPRTNCDYLLFKGEEICHPSIRNSDSISFCGADPSEVVFCPGPDSHGKVRPAAGGAAVSATSRIDREQPSWRNSMSASVALERQEIPEWYEQFDWS